MHTYAIGDIQGCFLTFMKLLDEIRFDHKVDRLILLGDVLNRGPRSLETVRYIKAHTDSIKMVLGNHEIFAIALALNAISSTRPHTLDEIMMAEDREEIIDFLRSRPLYLDDDKHFFVHAGLLPSFSIAHVKTCADELSEIISSPLGKAFLEKFFLKTPHAEKEHGSHGRNLRLCLASLVFIRMCESRSAMEPHYSGGPDKAQKGLKPWFDLRHDDKIIIFGHWAALGLYKKENYYCLDSGCGWGNKLTALRLSDKKIFQVNYCD